MKEIELRDIRAKLRREIESRYGSVTAFVNSEAGKKFGGVKIRPYLYDKGAVNIKVLSDLYQFFGLGQITRQVVVSRKVSYYVEDSSNA